jgi:hypothetical protein
VVVVVDVDSDGSACDSVESDSFILLVRRAGLSSGVPWTGPPLTVTFVVAFDVGGACAGVLVVVIVVGLVVSRAVVAVSLRLVRDVPIGWFNDPSCCRPAFGVRFFFRHPLQPPCPLHRCWN